MELINKDLLTKRLFEVEDGEYNALSLFIELNDAIKLLESSKKQISDNALNEAKKHNKSQFKGYLIEVRSSAGKWSYDHSEEYKKLSYQVNNMQEKMKAAFKSMHSFKLNSSDENGEVVIPASYQEGKETIFLTVKK